MTKQADIHFPVEWSYTVVTHGDPSVASQAIQAYFHEHHGITVVPQLGRSSREGTYQTWHFHATIMTREQLDLIHHGVSHLSCVRFLL